MPSITQLEEKITDLLASYNAIMVEVESLRKELVALRAESSQKDLQISALYEEIGNRDRAVESLYHKISTTLQNKMECEASKADDE